MSVLKELKSIFFKIKNKRNQKFNIVDEVYEIEADQSSIDLSHNVYLMYSKSNKDDINSQECLSLLKHFKELYSYSNANNDEPFYKRRLFFSGNYQGDFDEIITKVSSDINFTISLVSKEKKVPIHQAANYAQNLYRCLKSHKFNSNYNNIISDVKNSLKNILKNGMKE